MANFDIAQNFRTGANQNTITNLWMAFIILLARPPQSHRMQHRDIVSHHRCLPDHDRMRMIDHQPAPDYGGWMNINSKDFRNPRLEKIRQVFAPVAPQGMAHAIGLDGLKAFEKEQWLRKTMAGWITFTHGHQIGPGISTQVL